MGKTFRSDGNMRHGQRTRRERDLKWPGARPDRHERLDDGANLRWATEQRHVRRAAQIDDYVDDCPEETQ
jgi:hypothetical protein